MLDEEYHDVVKQAWKEGDTGGTSFLMARLKLASCQAGLKRWSVRKFGSADRVLKNKRKQLVELHKSASKGNVADIKNLQQEINFILEQEDIRWKQRAKQKRYNSGDQNTPFFHA
jgi:hypothetical protein